MSWKVGAVLRGSYSKEIANGRRVLSDVVRHAVQRAAEDSVLLKLRDDVRTGLPRGKRFANTWRMKVYPRPGSSSLDAAAWIYSNEPIIVDAFERGVRIHVRNRKFLMIPSGFVRALRPRGGRPDLYKAALQRFGQMRFVPLKRGNAMLVVSANTLTTKQQRSARRRGASVIRTSGRAGGRSGGQRRGAFTDVVMFWLVKETRLPKLLDGRAIRARGERDFPVKFQSYLEHELNVRLRQPALAA